MDPDRGFQYRDADAETRDRLLATLDGPDAPDTNTIDNTLLALAWIGDTVVQQAFAAWRTKPPSWRAAIHCAPHAYAAEAGWILRDDGTRRDLYVPRARAIVRSDHAGGPLQVLGRHDETCRYCSQPLGVLFDLDVAASGLPFSARRLIIPFCHMCSAGERIAFVIDDTGAHWHEANPPSKPSGEFRPWDEGLLVLGPELASPFACHGWQADDLGHIGGVPGWIDDAYYPECVECGQPSQFVGQLAVASGGRFYAFACETCRVVTTTYQQT